MGYKKSKNISLDKDIIEFFSEEFEGNASQVVNSMSREFMRKFRKNKNVQMDIVYGNFKLDCESDSQEAAKHKK